MSAQFKLLAHEALTVTDMGVRIAAIITIDGVNQGLATVIALLTIYHLVIKIRRERGDDKSPKN